MEREHAEGALVLLVERAERREPVQQPPEAGDLGPRLGKCSRGNTSLGLFNTHSAGRSITVPAEGRSSIIGPTISFLWDS